MSAYSESLKTKEWQQKRFEIFERDGHVCRRCGAEGYLQVHHWWYWPGRPAHAYPNEALVSLCRPCHKHVQKDMAIAQEMFFRFAFSWSQGHFLEMPDEHTYLPGFPITCAYLRGLLSINGCRIGRHPEDMMVFLSEHGIKPEDTEAYYHDIGNGMCPEWACLEKIERILLPPKKPAKPSQEPTDSSRAIDRVDCSPLDQILRNFPR